MKTDVKTILMDMYDRLLRHFGPRNWWPADTPLEVMVGAVLTQTTPWKNVEKAIAALKNNGRLSLSALHNLPHQELAQLIRPCGYYNLKALRLKNLLDLVFKECQGDLHRFFQEDTERLRQRLLTVKGVGPETADSILLYAGGLPSFVVDAYTCRVLHRHGCIQKDASYEEVRRMFMDHLPREVPLYNEFHALFVRVGKYHCRKSSPLCKGCPLEGVGGYP